MATPSRLAALNRIRCSIFQTSYNPTGLRTGAKYLSARLRGPSLVKYYPHKLDLARVMREFPELEFVDAKEEQRVIDVSERRKRGKGAPKKSKAKGEYPLLTDFAPCSRYRQVRVGERLERDRGEHAGGEVWGKHHRIGPAVEPSCYAEDEVIRASMSSACIDQAVCCMSGLKIPTQLAILANSFMCVLRAIDLVLLHDLGSSQDFAFVQYISSKRPVHHRTDLWELPLRIIEFLKVERRTSCRPLQRCPTCCDNTAARLGCLIDASIPPSKIWKRSCTGSRRPTDNRISDTRPRPNILPTIPMLRPAIWFVSATFSQSVCGPPEGTPT
jgi:small subunit ribosomal protein S33